MDGRKVNKERLEELIETLNLKGRENHLPQSAVGRPAAKGVHWQGIDKCSFGGACGRTHGKPGFEKQPGNCGTFENSPIKNTIKP